LRSKSLEMRAELSWSRSEQLELRIFNRNRWCTFGCCLNNVPLPTVSSFQCTGFWLLHVRDDQDRVTMFLRATSAGSTAAVATRFSKTLASLVEQQCGSLLVKASDSWSPCVALVVVSSSSVSPAELSLALVSSAEQNGRSRNFCVVSVALVAVSLALGDNWLFPDEILCLL